MNKRNLFITTRPVVATVLAAAIVSSVQLGATTNQSLRIFGATASAQPGVTDVAEYTPERVQALLSAPMPTEVDALLAHVKAISQAATAVNDEVQQAQLDIDASQQRIAEFRAKEQSARQRADELFNSLSLSESKLRDIAQAHYRGVTTGQVSLFAGAGGPVDLAERAAYLATINQSNNATIDAAHLELVGVAEAHSEASRAKASATFQERFNQKRKETWEARSRDLEQLQQAVMQAVDGLGPEDRRRWVEQNGPINVDVEAFLASANFQSAFAGDAAAAANAQGVVASALSRIGAPYSWGATGPDAFDCSGLMVWAYAQHGKTIPRTSQAQLAGGTKVARSEIQPGDLVIYFAGASHVGMYIGDGKIVHASDYGIPVQVVPMDVMPVSGIVRY